MSEVPNSIKAAEELRGQVYQALLARLDAETRRLLMCYQGLQVAIGLASGNWRCGLGDIWDWKDHALGDAIAEAHELLSAAEKVARRDLSYASITAVASPDSGL